MKKKTDTNLFFTFWDVVFLLPSHLCYELRKSIVIVKKYMFSFQLKHLFLGPNPNKIGLNSGPRDASEKVCAVFYDC